MNDREAFDNRRALEDQDAEIERLRAVILDIARIVENPDDRALQQVRDVTDKHSSDCDHLWESIPGKPGQQCQRCRMTLDEIEASETKASGSDSAPTPEG